MGCDIHSFAERKTANGYETIRGVDFAEGTEPFSWRAYGMFGFLADVRNYSAVPPLAERRGFPDDASPDAAKAFAEWEGDAHSASWLSVEELAAFDYNQQMEDRRVMRNNDGGCTAKRGEGRSMTFREFLGDGFIEEIVRLKSARADRIVFFFDS